jgi:hypothetical protein
MKEQISKPSIDNQRNHYLEQSNKHNSFFDSSSNSFSEGVTQKKENPFFDKPATNPFFDKPATNPFFDKPANNPSPTSPIQKKENNTSLPENLKTGMENLSGISMDDVKVHHNSDKPTQLQAHAYAQGTDIHLASGQEQHLPHELAHVVQQKQGRVKPTMQMKGEVNVNDDAGLEREADVMGAKALQTKSAHAEQVQSIGTVGNCAPIQMVNPFKRKNKKLDAPLESLNTGTASDVYKATTKGKIGKTGSKVGFAKKGLKAGGQGNDTTANLGLGDKGSELENDPNLLARQVASSRLDRKLGMGVTAHEIYSKDTDGNDIGITGMAKGTQAMENAKDGKQVHNEFNFRDPRIQKGLADLQLMDALTGQLDRHLGNIFIDRQTGQVTGIDNDMSFASNKSGSNVMAQNSLLDQFKGSKDKMKFDIKRVDASSAKKILKLSEDDFKEILKGKSTDPEHIDETAIKNAVYRLTAVKKKLQELKDKNELITKWDDSTYDAAVGDGVDKTAINEGHFNYTARAVRGFETAADPANSAKRQGQAPIPAEKKKRKNPFKRKSKTKKQLHPVIEQHFRNEQQELNAIFSELGF